MEGPKNTKTVPDTFVFPHEHGDLIDALQDGDFAAAFECLRTHLLSGAPSSMSERIDRELPMEFEEMRIYDQAESLFAIFGSESQMK